MTQNFSLATYCPGPTDATSFYRGILPLAILKKQLKQINLNLTFLNETSWATSSMVNAGFMQRPYTHNHLLVMKELKKRDVPVWIDYDDNLFHVPRDNPTYESYGKPETHKNIAEICAMADIISVSTEQLKKDLQKLNKNIVVIKNAIDDTKFEAPEAEPKRRRLILWRGSKTHTRDLMSVSNEIVELARANPTWVWCFLGDDPWYITERMQPKQYICLKPVDIHEYFIAIRQMNAAIKMVPLMSSAFNHCKSNIAWIEGTYAASVTVAPDWQEWRQPGVLNYADPKDFREKMQMAIDMSDADRNARVKQSWHTILNEFTLTQNNKQRWDIIKFLAQRQAKVTPADWRGETLESEITSFKVQVDELIEPGLQ